MINDLFNGLLGHVTPFEGTTWEIVFFMPCSTIIALGLMWAYEARLRPAMPEKHTGALDQFPKAATSIYYVLVAFPIISVWISFQIEMYGSWPPKTPGALALVKETQIASMIVVLAVAVATILATVALLSLRGPRRWGSIIGACAVLAIGSIPFLYAPVKTMAWIAHRDAVDRTVFVNTASSSGYNSHDARQRALVFYDAHGLVPPDFMLDDASFEAHNLAVNRITEWAKAKAGDQPPAVPKETYGGKTFAGIDYWTILFR